MARVVSLYFPTWPTDRLRRALGQSAPSAETPIVMLGRQGNRRLVLAADAAARAVGLRVGMPASKAQVLVPALQSFDLDPAGDAEALDRMALWSLRYAPIVAADPLDGLIIDTTGADHLHGGEEVMLAGLVSRIAASGIDTRAAVADTWGAAHACAGFLARPTFVAPAGQAGSIVRDLPISALRLSPDIVDGLHTLGFERISEVEAAPRASLTLRFGPELGRRLDQAVGGRSEPFEPIRSPELVAVRRAFGEPISAAETIARYVGKLVVMLCEGLEASLTGMAELRTRRLQRDARQRLSLSGPNYCRIIGPTGEDFPHHEATFCPLIWDGFGLRIDACSWGTTAMSIAGWAARPATAKELLEAQFRDARRDDIVSVKSMIEMIRRLVPHLDDTDEELTADIVEVATHFGFVVAFDSRE